MKIVADTNTFLAVALDEPEKARLVELTEGYELMAPESLPFEMGNALTALMRRGSLNPHETLSAWDAMQAMPVELRKIDVRASLAIAGRFGVCAYDAYFIECALNAHAPLITLDRRMRNVAADIGIEVLE